MATYDDVARLALPLPETTEGVSYGWRAPRGGWRASTAREGPRTGPLPNRDQMTYSMS